MSVRIENKGKVRTIIHSRPEARNAMDPASAHALAHEIARFPHACMRADRRSVYTQHGLSLREAMTKEWYNGVPAFAAEGADGAARFAAGKGRHGNFGDL